MQKKEKEAQKQKNKDKPNQKNSNTKKPLLKKPTLKKSIPKKKDLKKQEPKKPDSKDKYHEEQITKDKDKNVLVPKKTTKEGVVESYDIEVDKAKVIVQIKKATGGFFYNLYVPEISIATSSLLSEVRNELVTITTVGMKEIINPKAYNEVKKRFMREAENILKQKLPTIKEDVKEFLIGRLMQEMLGLGEIEFLINDPNLEEVVILSSKKTIRVYHKKLGWLTTNLTVEKEEDIINYSNIIARRVGRQINVLSPLLDAHLVSGDRVNAILYPISTDGNTITIRKFARDPYTIVDLINNKTINLEVAVLLWIAIEYEMNILISGGTASGKTVLLNSCMPFIPPNHRIISVEDTRELMLPDFLYWCPLVTRSPNPEGKGAVSMLDLLVNSLRMRPDRIILGEMRREEEARVLFEAMHTGHSVYATLHADSTAETVSRLTNPPLNVPPNLLKAVNLNVVVFRDRRRGIRRVLQIGEFESGSDRASANIIYRWIPEKDEIVQHSESSRFFEDILRITGMSNKELKENLEEKKTIINALIKDNIRELNNMGKVMNLYYSDKEELIKAISKNNLKKILEG